MNNQSTRKSQEGNNLHRSGVVAIIGPPNAGKSTLLNYFLGQKIAIVTPKPQTTRNRILGILTGDAYQIILLDTPGLHQPRELLNREMVRIAMDTLAEADVVLFMADAQLPGEGKREKLREEFATKVRRKHAALKDIRDVVEEKLRQMLGRNPRRMDYYKKYQEIIADYNREKDRATVEETFAELTELA